MIKQSFSAQNCLKVALNEHSGTLMRCKWKVIFIIVNNYCYLRVSCLLQWGYDVSRAVLQRHQAAPGNTLLTLSMKHAFTILHKTLPFPKYGHKCLKLFTEDNNEENKGTQTSCWSSLNWEKRTSKNEKYSIT